MDDAEKVATLALTRRFLEELVSDPSFTTALDSDTAHTLPPLLREVAKTIDDHHVELVRKNRELALNDVADYIDRFYNRTRRHSHPSGVSPEQFEAAQKRR